MNRSAESRVIHHKGGYKFVHHLDQFSHNRIKITD